MNTSKLPSRCLVSLLAGELPDALRAGEHGYALVEAGEPVRATALMLELEGGEDLPHTNPPGRCISYEILTRAALAAGRPDQAAGWAARAEASASGLGDGLFAGLARRARAAVLLEQGEARAAAQAAVEAAAGAERPGARNTVESHLKRIFAKLEVRNRAAVAAVLVRRRDHARSP